MTNCWLEDEMYCLMILYRILSGICIISLLFCICICYKRGRSFIEDKTIVENINQQNV